MIRYDQVTVDGVAIRYAGEGNRAPLVLLHGAPFDHRIWLPLIPYLSGHFRVIAPDLPGAGGTALRERYHTPEQLFRLFAGMLTTLQMVPAYVVGAGIGGGIALGVASRYPERVRGVVAIGSVGVRWWPETGMARLARRMVGGPGLAGLLLQIAPRIQARHLLRSALGDPAYLSDALVEQILPMWRDARRRRAMVQLLRNLDEWQILGRRLGGVQAPTLLVWGERDRWYGLPAAEALRRAVPAAQLVTFDGAGHAVPIERPIDLAELIRRFFIPVDGSRMPTQRNNQRG
ncbi:MAG TPA: alpha/beta fold hydrolase [Roseiflexaceae bacterium]|nr:alpha/beta fold hydrolase [Roseiflexaceae bacterium]